LEVSACLHHVPHFFPRLERHHPPFGKHDLFAGPRISGGSAFLCFHIKHTETAKFKSVSIGKGIRDGVEGALDYFKNIILYKSKSVGNFDN